MQLCKWVLVAGLVSGECYGEEFCFRSAAEAVAQRGVRDGVGFRLEGVRVDRLGGGAWARVVSCEHPERPGVSVRVEQGVEGKTVADKVAVRVSQAERVMVAGTRVRVVRTEAMARVEVSGIVQDGGAVGDRVRVRIEARDGGEARFLEGLVMGVELVEVGVSQ